MIKIDRRIRTLFVISITSVVILLCLITSCRVIEQAGSYIRYSVFKQADTENFDDAFKLEGEEIMLPEPEIEEGIPLGSAMAKRRSVRSFSDKELEMEKISQILWAAQGITQQSTGYRTAPSAGALYPLELFLIKSDGVFHYRPRGHKLVKMISEDVRIQVAEGSVFQDFIATAPVSIVMAGVLERTTVKYGERGIRYVYIEAGHSCQNILLQAVSLELGAVPVGAFDDDYIQSLLGLPTDYQILYVIPVGYPQ
ncbi:SagB/ThcOx family dehydrogenase [Actinomycetota bacterium]